jgi:MFS family permease
MQGWLDARSQALCWSAVFFLASAAASSAYLTVSEVFPLEMRAMAIAIFYAVGMGAGGFAAPLLFGLLIETGSRGAVMVGYGIGAVLVIVGGCWPCATRRMRSASRWRKWRRRWRGGRRKTKTKAITATPRQGALNARARRC